MILEPLLLIVSGLALGGLCIWALKSNLDRHDRRLAERRARTARAADDRPRRCLGNSRCPYPAEFEAAPGQWRCAAHSLDPTSKEIDR